MPQAPHALAVYVESLAADRRVMLVGDASLGLADRLLDLGARAVLVWDPDEERAAQEAERAPGGVVVRPLPFDDTDVRPGAVDLALVADLALFDDPQGVLALVRQAVGDDGVAIVAASNRDAAPPDVPAFDYYELFDLVAGEFEDVRMVAQLSFHGVALAELGREDEAPSVSVDTQLAPAGRAPDAFVAVASSGGVALEPYCIVELPGAGLEDEGEQAEAAEEEEREEESLRLLEEMRARLVEAERASSAVLAERAEQLRERGARIGELERSLAQRAAQLAEISVEVEEMRSAAEAGRVAAVQVGELARRADRAERALAAMEPELSRVGDAHAAEHARFEEALRDRAQAIRTLETEVARRDRMVRELVDRLEESTGPQGAAAEPAEEPAEEPAPAPADDLLARENVALRQKLDALALELARREGDAQAAAWAVAELERRVGQAERAVAERAVSQAAGPASTPPSADVAAAQSKLAAALDELDVLRQAVAQEHTMRMRAESGEELARAKAEIQRQAALLEQLGHPAGGPPAAADLHSSGK
jgi:hypothetical protein